MIQYRKAAAEDIDSLLTVRLDFLRGAQNIRNEEDERILLRSNREFLSASLADASFIQWLAVDGDKIVATGSVSFYSLPPNTKRPSGKVGYIGNMFTYPEYRGQGIATRLFAMIVEEAKQAGCGEICLDATDMGRPIYEKYGFQKAGDAMIYHTA